MDNNILSALQALDVATLTRDEWIRVGMALKEEGFDCSVWDEWSQNDSRYKAGECEQKWAGFHGNSDPVKGGTIVQLAKDHGWTPSMAIDEEIGWGDAIEYDGAGSPAPVKEPDDWNPVHDLFTFINTLFEPSDIVGYVTNDAWQDAEGDWNPGRGVFDRTAQELLDSLEKHPDDLGATVGDWKPECGAWIKFNPLDGGGVKSENVTRFTYALVECDKIPIPQQNALYRRLQLPIATLVNSGNKSLHAVVHIDAKDYDEYRKRVSFLYDFLDNNGCIVDRQNRNPSRMTRMPGVTRNGNHQYLVATNIGKRSWDEWKEYADTISDDLPPLVSLSDYKDNPPVLPEELIEGILRRGHKMLISGSSKAGKSFLLMELCIAIAEGTKWLGFQCRKGRVLYVNLEIDPASAINRFLKIYEALHLPMNHSDDIEVWNLRGHAIPLDQLVPRLINRVKGHNLDAIVIDPIYKVITGDENNASEMGQFCNQFDKICSETGCASIYCHHHSKGAQGAKRAMDRASGSGVFARDPDAQLDMIQLELSDDLKNNVADGGATAWRLESSLREFQNITPVNFWFEYPIHRLDESGELTGVPAEGSMEANLSKSSKRVPEDEQRSSIETAYSVCKAAGPVTVTDMAEYLQIDEKTVRRRIKKLEDQFFIKNGIVFEVQDTPSD